MDEVVESSAIKLDITKAVKDAIEIYKNNAVLLILSGIIVCIGSLMCLGLLAGPLMIGMFIISDRLATGDADKPTIGDLSQGFLFFIQGFVLMLVAVSGTLLCFVGVLVTAPVAILGMLRITDKGGTLGEAIMFGFNTIFRQGHWIFIILIIVASVFSQLGSVLCYFGVLLTLPFYFTIIVCGYRQLFPKS